MKKRQRLALVIAMVMCMTIFPYGAFAATTNTISTQVTVYPETLMTTTLNLQASEHGGFPAQEQIKIRLELTNAEWSESQPTITVKAYSPEGSEISGAIGAITKFYSSKTSEEFAFTPNVTLERGTVLKLDCALVSGREAGDVKLTLDGRDSRITSGTYTVGMVRGLPNPGNPILHTVKFFDRNGALLKTENVPNEGSATAPSAPEVTGYTFVGWDKLFNRVNKDLDVKATYKVKDSNLPITNPIINPIPGTSTPGSLNPGGNQLPNAGISWIGSGSPTVGPNTSIPPVKLNLAVDGTTLEGRQELRINVINADWKRDNPFSIRAYKPNGVEQVDLIVSPIRYSDARELIVEFTPKTAMEAGSLVQIDANLISGSEVGPAKMSLDASGTTAFPSGIHTVANVLPQNNQNLFTDVSAMDWFYGAVLQVYQQGLMQGVSATEFGGSIPADRRTFITILHRFAGSPNVVGSSFSDVVVGSWYEKPVAWASQNGIVKGYSDDRFGTNDLLSRQDLVTILYNYARISGKDVSITQTLNTYEDSAMVSPYALPAMQWAVEKGIIRGYGNLLAPKASTTRAQIAMIFVNYGNFAK